jgi:hypothetical protein
MPTLLLYTSFSTINFTRKIDNVAENDERKFVRTSLGQVSTNFLKSFCDVVKF